MGDNNNGWTNLGEQFIESVTEAINTRDFSGVNDLVAQTVSNALQEAKNQALREKERQREKVQRQYDDWQQGREEREQADRERREFYERERERQRIELQQKQQQWQQERQERRERSIRDAQLRQAARTPEQIMRDMRTMIKVRKVGNVSGVLNTIFGIAGIGIAAINLIPSLLSMLFAGGDLFVPVFWMIFGMFFVSMLNRGTKQRERLKRAERYIQICGYKMYETIEELAKKTGKTVRYVRKDLRRMLKLGIFPEGHLDAQETCFMLNDTVFQQYEQTASAYRQEEEARRLEAENAAKAQAEQAAGAPQTEGTELDIMVAEGREYIRRLRKLNDDIPGELISNKLYQLENLLNEIFDRVKEHPEQMHRMHKVMEYYLPTTLKLVEAYKEFSEVSVPGEDIKSAMLEIEKTLDTINRAFEELLNALFQDAALDVTTDAQVLQTMLAREGLTRELEPVPATKTSDGL